jgi:hypothetical protein
MSRIGLIQPAAGFGLNAARRASRFVCLCEPTNTWAVWDDARNQPAELAEALVGLTERDARKACLALNMDNRRRHYGV